MFKGTIPSAFFNISSHTDIHFPKNQLEGGLPQDSGFKLPNCQSSNVANDSFTGIISTSISNASNLMRLTIPLNNFTARVPSLENLSGLQWRGSTMT